MKLGTKFIWIFLVPSLWGQGLTSTNCSREFDIWVSFSTTNLLREPLDLDAIVPKKEHRLSKEQETVFGPIVQQAVGPHPQIWDLVSDNREKGGARRWQDNVLPKVNASEHNVLPKVNASEQPALSLCSHSTLLSLDTPGNSHENGGGTNGKGNSNDAGGSGGYDNVDSHGQGHNEHGNGNGYGHDDHGNGHGYGHDVHCVPEPNTWALVCIGCLGLLLCKRRLLGFVGFFCCISWLHGAEIVRVTGVVTLEAHTNAIAHVGAFVPIGAVLVTGTNASVDVSLVEGGVIPESHLQRIAGAHAGNWTDAFRVRDRSRVKLVKAEYQAVGSWVGDVELEVQAGAVMGIMRWIPRNSICIRMPNSRAILERGGWYECSADDVVKVFKGMVVDVYQRSNGTMGTTNVLAGFQFDARHEVFSPLPPEKDFPGVGLRFPVPLEPQDHTRVYVSPLTGLKR